MVELYLIRHAQPKVAESRFARLLGKVQANSSALSDVGRAQALVTAQALCHLSATALFTSPIPRALETAKYLSASLHLEPRIQTDLQEQHTGRLLKHIRPTDIPQLFPGEWQRWQSGDPDYSPPGGESTGTFLLRVDRFLSEMRRYTGTVIAVTHFGFIQGVICRVLDLSFRYSMPLDFGEASITHVRLLDSERVLVAMNQTNHWEIALGIPSRSFRVNSAGDKP